MNRVSNCLGHELWTRDKRAIVNILCVVYANLEVAKPFAEYKLIKMCPLSLFSLKEDAFGCSP